MFFFCTLATLDTFPTSYCMKTVLVEFESSAMMHAHSTLFSVLPNAEPLIGEESRSLPLCYKKSLGKEIDAN